MKKDVFQTYHEQIYQFNLTSLQRLSLMGLCVSTILLILSLPMIHVLNMMSAYFALTVVFLLFYMGSKSKRSKREGFVQRFYYMLIVFLLLIAIGMGTYLDPNNSAFTFYLFLIVVPMFVVDRPWRLNTMLGIMSCLFLFLVVQVKHGEVMRLDISNCLVSAAISMVMICMNVRNRVNDMISNEELKEKARVEHALYKAQNATNAKSEFLARMSHDIRTPMNVIIGITNLAEDELDHPEAIKDYLDKIHASSRYLLGLVNDCLDMEKIESGNMTLHPVPYTYNEFEGAIKTLICPLCEEKKITFQFDKPEQTKTVLVDKIRFEQIFINVLSNAVKFTPVGGRIEFIDRAAVKDGDILHNHYTIRDTGIGMSKEFQKKLFMPFTQESSEIIPQTQGTGLGLSIVKRIVEMMDGMVSIESEQGKGTKVDIVLDFPIYKEEETKIEGRKPSASLDGKRVLLLEDHPLNTEIAKKLLEKKHMIVDCAENGKVGIQMFEDSKEGYYQVILTDIRMPVMDGLEAVKVIRNLDRQDAKDIPIIAMSANAYEEDVHKSLQAGMNAHLAKPIEPERLYGMLYKYI